jgi:hypothetical protein
VSGLRPPFAWKHVMPTQVNTPGGDLRPPWADQPHVRPDHARRSTRDRGGQVAQLAVGDVPGYTRRPAAQACLLPRVCGLLNAPVVEAKPFELRGGAGPLARSANRRVDQFSKPSGEWPLFAQTRRPYPSGVGRSGHANSRLRTSRWSRVNLWAGAPQPESPPVCAS